MRKFKREIFLCIRQVKVWKPQVSAYEEERLGDSPHLQLLKVCVSAALFLLLFKKTI
jgi:hypothetical protein